MIGWVFWDVGDTLLNEDHLRCRLYERLHAAIARAIPAFTFDELLARRAQLIAAGDAAPHYTIARQLLRQEAHDAWVDEVRRFVLGDGQRLISPVVGVPELLERLHRRFSMGIIADQPPVVDQTLERCGIRQAFDLVALDSVVGASKPDVGLFQWALDRAGCAAGEAVMVGNRLDRDIAPARRLGMKTLFCYLSPGDKGWTPATPHEQCYFQALDQVPNWPRRPACSEQMPDARVDSLRRIEPLLATWARRS